MRPVSRGYSRHSLVDGDTCRKTPISRFALDKIPMPGQLFEDNPFDEGTTRRGTDTPGYRPEKPAGTTHSSRSDLSPVNNWRGKQSSIPPLKTRPDSPVRTLQRNCDPSQIWPRGSQERKHEFPASTRDEALFHCTKPSGVPRDPSQLHSIPDFSEAPLDLPEITGTSRGNQGFPAPTRKRPRESFFNAS